MRSHQGVPKLKCGSDASRVKQINPLCWMNILYTAFQISTSSPFSATGIISFDLKTAFEDDFRVNAGLSVNKTV